MTMIGMTIQVMSLTVWLSETFSLIMVMNGFACENFRKLLKIFRLCKSREMLCGRSVIEVTSSVICLHLNWKKRCNFVT